MNIRVRSLIGHKEVTLKDKDTAFVSNGINVEWICTDIHQTTQEMTITVATSKFKIRKDRNDKDIWIDPIENED